MPARITIINQAHVGMIVIQPKYFLQKFPLFPSSINFILTDGLGYARKKGFSLGCNTARVSKKPARQVPGGRRVVGTRAMWLFGFGEVCLDVFRLDVVEVAGAGIDGEADEPAEEDVAPDPAGDGMGESRRRWGRISDL